MDTQKIIDLLGGRKAVIEMTGLTRGRIHQWVKANSIPRPWLKFFHEKFPSLDWADLLGASHLIDAALALEQERRKNGDRRQGERRYDRRKSDRRENPQPVPDSI